MQLPYKYHDLGDRKRGDRFVVHLSGSAANLLLLDSSNFASFRAGRDPRGVGGLATRSPIPFAIPSDGHWYLVVHMWGLEGTASWKIEWLPRPLPEIRISRQPELNTIIREVAGPDAGAGLPVSTEEFDLFISHATEDKEGLVRDLASALQDRGVSVWYDEFTLRVGDSLRRRIDQGLSRSRFGLVVLSQSFFAKDWPNYELDGLVALEMAGRQRILPVWHKVTKDEVLSYSAPLADKLALNTAIHTVDQIATEIASVVQAVHVPEGSEPAEPC